ncbi:arsenical pump-driving ATPase [Paenibacillus typhae]|uniref:Arsenite efflux ATP-binding protein ArsA n=1 Tax=Paenibacillus typhae TaxID=1174501 RepID=A0A1G8GIV6_9BACL|nr:arsenical pump-driving ATPase [Paenibacillus typhae]SDH94338.1 arsenite efflux ATP-binding protein ArsA [Paenibacillus typhae]
MTTLFDPLTMLPTPFLFFTGKGGVGKTSTACAAAIALADSGKRVLLVSTDPASNLQDVFGIELSNHPTAIERVPNLFAANLDPETAAAEYKTKLVAPYRGVLPDSVITSMEEQLSGACTVEIAAFDEFTTLLTDQKLKSQFDHILFDTAPTGHTLRLLQLPSAWSGFLDTSTHGASCLGPLAGLEAKKNLYHEAVKSLSDGALTTLILVTRPEYSPLKEAARASTELKDTGLKNQLLVVNGVLTSSINNDAVAENFVERQQKALSQMPAELQSLASYHIPLVPFNVTGIESLRAFFKPAPVTPAPEERVKIETQILTLEALISDLETSGVRVIFTMGKGGVGKTTVASAIAVGLAERGHRVHLSTTDPAAHLEYVFGDHSDQISVSRVDPKVELEKYQQEVIRQNADSLDEEGLAFLEEDLRSPCTEEIAVFRAFADLVECSEDEIVVIDTAPTGHTLLLLDATQEYHKEIARSSGVIPDSVQQLLPRLRDPKETSVVIVTLAEATPVYEASRLEQDLKRAGIPTKWWAINQSFAAAGTTDPVLSGRAHAELDWIRSVVQNAEGHAVIIPWKQSEVTGYMQLKELTSDLTLDFVRDEHGEGLTISGGSGCC